MLIAVLSIIVFIGLLILGMPVIYAIFAILFISVAFYGVSPSIIPVSAFFSLTSYILLAAPLFLFMGQLMGSGGMSTRLVAFANALVGKIKGGLAHVMVVACLFFGALSGSAVASVAAIGTILIPRMEEYGWNRKYSAALAASAAPLGALIPPSILGIMYAFVADVSIGRMFLATVGPGLVLALGYMILIYFWGAAKWYHPPTTPVAEKPKGLVREMARTGFIAFPAAIMPILVLGGIYGGVFTPTEAAAVGGAYALIIGLVIYRELNGKTIYRALLWAALIQASFFIIIVAVTPLTKILVTQGVVATMTEFILSISTNVYVILLMLNIIILILGMFIDGIPIVLAIVPLLLPLVSEMGLDPVHIGAMILVNVLFGQMTPPFAINIFMASKIANVPFHELLRPVSQFLFFVALPVLLLTTYIPQISLWLPNLIMGPR